MLPLLDIFSIDLHHTSDYKVPRRWRSPKYRRDWPCFTLALLGDGGAWRRHGCRLPSHNLASLRRMLSDVSNPIFSLHALVTIVTE